MKDRVKKRVKLQKPGLKTDSEYLKKFRSGTIHSDGDLSSNLSGDSDSEQSSFIINEEHFRYMSQTAHDAIITINSSSKIVYWNKAAEKIFGFTAGEILGERLTIIIPKFYHEAHKKGIQRLVNGGKLKYAGMIQEMKGLKKDGSEFPIELSVAMWSSNGNLYFTGILRDITRRKEVVDMTHFHCDLALALNTASGLNEALSLSVETAIQITGMDSGAIYLINKETGIPELAYHTGFSAKTVEDISCLDIHSDIMEQLMLGFPVQGLYDDINKFSGKNSEREDIKTTAVVPIAHEGSVISILLVSSHSLSELSEFTLNLIETIAAQIGGAIARLKAEHSLRESEAKLKELNANKDKFFSIISHDLRSPFTSLLGFSEFLMNEVEELSAEEIKEFAENIFKSARGTFALLENLLQWARVQTGRIEYLPSTYVLSDLVDEIADVYQITALRKKIEVKIDIDSEIKIYADKNMLLTIFRNLLSNSIKFTQAKGTITVSALASSETTEITISDTGIGINEKDIEKLFNISEHITTTGTQNEKGTGLGLILCKEFIEMNGGKIRVESKIGEGSKFIFSLPLVKSE